MQRQREHREGVPRIEALPAEDRRRPYKLTGAGQKVLKARLDSLRAMTRIGNARLAEL